MNEHLLFVWFLIALGFVIFDVARLTAMIKDDEDDTRISLFFMLTCIQIALLFWAWGSALHYKGF